MNTTHTSAPGRQIAALRFDPRANGPRTSANGGFASGRIAEILGGTASVSLHRPPPVGRFLDVMQTPDDARAITVLDGDEVVASARPAIPFTAEPPVRPTFAEAVAARAAHPFHGRRHLLSHCIVCGPDRADGMHVTPGSLIRAPDVLAAPFVPHATEALPGSDRIVPEAVWGALDCPSYPAGLLTSGRLALLARLTAHRQRDIHVGEELVVVGWTVHRGSRSHRTCSAILDSDGRVVASAHAVWVELRHQWLHRLVFRLGAGR